MTFLETLLTMVWYPTTVATLSRRCKDVIQKGFEKTVDDAAHFLLDSRLHDFGYETPFATSSLHIHTPMCGGCVCSRRRLSALTASRGATARMCHPTDAPASRTLAAQVAQRRVREGQHRTRLVQSGSFRLVYCS